MAHLTNRNPEHCHNPLCGKEIGPGEGIYLADQHTLYCLHCGTIFRTETWEDLMRRTEPAWMTQLETLVGRLGR